MAQADVKTQEQALQERQKFVAAFNDTMVKIWKERIILLDVIDTKRLLNSPISLGYKADGRLVDVQLTQAFRL
jgi:hypothetical protein